MAIATARPAGASESGAIPPALGRALAAYNAATVANDTTTLASLVADDYVLVNSDASIQDKASYLADFARPGFKIDPYAIEHPLYRVGGEAALTAGEIQLRWTQDGRRQSRRVRIAHVWLLRQGRWRIAYTQLTRLPETPGAGPAL
jgi:ketosteroid isomerase-like protein